MSGRHSEADALESMEGISAVARDLFAAHGYDGTTVDQIARAAGVSRATVFRLFRSKDDIVFARYQRELHRLRTSARALTGSDSDRTRGVLIELAGRLDAETEVFLPEVRLIAAHPQLRARSVLMLYGWAEILARDLGAGRRSGTTLPTRVVAHSGICAFQEAICWWRELNAGKPLTGLTRQALRVALPLTPKRAPAAGNGG